MPSLAKTALLLALILLPAGWASAEKTMYVGDRIQVVVRAAPQAESPAVDHISTGDLVSLLETSEGWHKIRTPKGREGWSPIRYFVESPPAYVRLRDMDPQGKNLAAQMEELRKDNDNLRRSLKESETRAGQAEANFSRLKKESAEVIRLREDCQRLREDYDQQAQRLEEVSAENESLRFGANLQWFLAGGGVMFVGWLLGLAFGRRRRRWHSGLE
jgi:SH3 domain protein